VNMTVVVSDLFPNGDVTGSLILNPSACQGVTCSPLSAECATSTCIAFGASAGTCNVTRTAAVTCTPVNLTAATGLCQADGSCVGEWVLRWAYMSGRCNYSQP
jgi:hypothetical protein